MAQTIDEIAVEKDSPKARLDNFLTTHKVKVAHSFEEVLGPDTGQSQDEIRAEIDDFMQLRERWRKENRERSFD